MLLSRAELSGFFIGIVIVAIMAFIVFHGKFNDVNKPHPTAFKPIVVKIVTAPKTIGQFVPAAVTVHEGQSITWTNVSNADHTATDTSKNLAFDSGDIGTGGKKYTIQRVTLKPGVYHYICSYHPNMHGTLRVVA